MNEQIKLSEEEIEIANQFYTKRIEYLIKLGEVKLSEINNKKVVDETYFNLTELNTRESQFMGDLFEKYGTGSINLSEGSYVRNLDI
jgi:hypothetical protein